MKPLKYLKNLCDLRSAILNNVQKELVKVTISKHGLPNHERSSKKLFTITAVDKIEDLKT